MNNPSNKELAKSLLARATERDPSEVPETATVESWDAWDSLSHMRLILAMEAHLGRELPPEAVVEIASLPDVEKFLA